MTAFRRAGVGLVCFLLVQSASLYAKAGKLAFDRISLEQGLSQALVRAIIQDRQGYLWIGTMEGLNRYDGYSFLVFRHEPADPRSISNDSITALAQDREGRIWVGTESGGLNRFDPGTGGFNHWLHDPSRPGSIGNNDIGAIWIDPAGSVWIGTSAGLDRFDAISGDFLHYPLSPPDNGSSAVLVRAISPSLQEPGILWLGTSKGLLRLSTGDGRIRPFVHREGDRSSLIQDDVQALYESPSAPGTLWVGTLVAGLDQFDMASSRFRHWIHEPGNPDSISSNRVRAIFEEREGSLLIGTDGGGLNRLDRQTGLFTRYANDPRDVTSLGQNSVLAIAQDRAGFIWLGTSGGGLNRINIQKSLFQHYKNEPGVADSLQVDDVLSVCVPRREPHLLWVGNQDGGLNRLDRQTGRVAHFLHDPVRENSLAHNSVYTILESPAGKLWLGTMKGLDLLNPASGRFTHFRNDPGRPDSLPQDFVLTLFLDHDQRLWVGTRLGGLALMTDPGGRFLTFRSVADDPSTLAGNSILSIVQTRENPDLLWVGTSTGLCRFDIRSFACERRPIDIQGAQRIEVNYIMDVAPSSTDPGVYWLATREGMVRFDSRQNRFAQVLRGLPGKVVYTVIPISAGQEEYLWLSTSKGLCRYHPRTGLFKNFGWGEGIQVSDFNRGAYFHSPAGEVFFGGTLGLYAFFPSEITDNPVPPPVVITQMRVNEQNVTPLDPILERGEMVLRYNQNFISFEFSALDFTIPDKNRFAYQMEGIDADWIYRDSSRRFASYTDVKPGSYTFRVKAANNDGVWNETGVSLRVLVRPPFWQTWWFYTVLGMLALGTVYGTFRWRVRSLERRQEELEALVAQRTQELKEASLKDPLTGLRNRRFVTEIVKSEAKAFLSSKDHIVRHGLSRRDEGLASKVFGIYMLDIDHFKAVNDQYGHEAGDRLLLQLAETLVSETRQDDVVVRMGGEEFLIVLKKTEDRYVDEFAAKIKKSIERHTFSLSEDARELKKTLSIGYATLPFYQDEPDRVTLEQAIGLADLGLLHSKKMGRNRITRVQPTGEKMPPAEFGRVLSSLDYALERGWLQVFTG